MCHRYEQNFPTEDNTPIARDITYDAQYKLLLTYTTTWFIFAKQKCVVKSSSDRFWIKSNDKWRAYDATALRTKESSFLFGRLIWKSLAKVIPIRTTWLGNFESPHQSQRIPIASHRNFTVKKSKLISLTTSDASQKSTIEERRNHRHSFDCIWEGANMITERRIVIQNVGNFDGKTKCSKTLRGLVLHPLSCHFNCGLFLACRACWCLVDSSVTFQTSCDKLLLKIHNVYCRWKHELLQVSSNTKMKIFLFAEWEFDLIEKSMQQFCCSHWTGCPSNRRTIRCGRR